MDGRRVLVFHFIIQTYYFTLSQGYAFENCDDGFTHHGNCTVVERDGAIGSQSVNSIILKGGYSDFGKRTGCPYQAGSCEKGFSFYGWVKFFSYVEPCNNYGVYVTNQQFAVHLLGNGRLSVYVWMKNDLQWHAESVQPVQLGFWYPLIIQFDYNKTLGNGSLLLLLQDQPVAFSNCTERRTYKPPLDNHIFGSDGNSTNHYIHMQLDRTNWDGEMKTLEHVIGVLIDPPQRKGNCLNKPFSTLTRQFQCFWLQKDDRKNWTDAYKACNKPAYDAGYPYGRLARFQPEASFFTWQSSKTKFAEAGQNNNGYLAWIGGGRKLHWLDNNMTTVDDVYVPEDVKYETTGADSETCLALNTTASPWQWLELNCSLKQGFICEMSWDCMLLNPCQNFGACIPLTDGPTCKCYPGSSGKFCENGNYTPACINDCPCKPIQEKFCLASTPTLTGLRNATECQEKLTEPLKRQVKSLDVMYNETLEVKLKEQFALKYNKTCAKTELPYGSRDYPNSTWTAYLTYRLYAKINLWYVKALCSDADNSETASLLCQYKECVEIFEESKKTLEFQNIHDKHSPTEREEWTKLFKDSES